MRNEYPRPDFVREDWMSLNGEWDFYGGGAKRTIQVPFVCQSAMSGIGERIRQDQVLYERTFSVPETWKGKRIFINFGAVDYQCRVWINGQMAGGHTGGNTPFSLDITPLLNWKEERIRVEATDWLKDESIARGKQFWEEEPRFIWYTPSTGIWQSVWLEPVEETRFEQVHFTPDIDTGTVGIDYLLAKTSSLPCRVEFQIFNKGEEVFQGSFLAKEYRGTITADVFQKKALKGSFQFEETYWSPEKPNLHRVFMTAEGQDGQKDQVDSYFGMRKIEVKNGKIYLNRRPYYQKLVLDQGYWKDSLITAPSDEAYREDIEKAKAMGFNGCRKHEKAEDPRFLYWADRLGFLVWESMASFWMYTPNGAAAFAKEWTDLIMRDYNHPCIVVWGMLNESWGVPEIGTDRRQRAFSKALYHLAHSLDDTRLVVSNDGWEITDSDICAFHSYRHGSKDDLRQQERFARCLKSLEEMEEIVEKPLFAPGFGYEGQPVLLTEFGGITISTSQGEWGYTSVKKEGFLKEYRRIMEAIADSKLLWGYCYTQLTDIEQEANGLLTADHQYKFDPAEIKRIQEMCGDGLW